MNCPEALFKLSLGETVEEKSGFYKEPYIVLADAKSIKHYFTVVVPGISLFSGAPSGRSISGEYEFNELVERVIAEISLLSLAHCIQVNRSAGKLQVPGSSSPRKLG